MADDLTTIFKNYIISVEEQSNEKPRIKSKKNSNNTFTEFKIQSIKLLESVFSLRTLLEELHEEYVSLIPQNDSSNEKRTQMENNSIEIMKLCKDFLIHIRSSKFINPSLPKDVRMHREAVCQMLSIYVKACDDLSQENNHIKRSRRSVKKHYNPIDDSVGIVSGSVNFVESDFSPQDREMMQIHSDGVFRRLNAELAEKDMIVKQIHEIGKMNQTLADNVLEQHTLIDQLEMTSSNSNSNLEYGNEQMQRAMQNQSNMRFWVIFILLVLALSLLFIDWYSA